MKIPRSDSRMLWQTRTRSQRVCPSTSNSSTASQRVYAVNAQSPRDESSSERERSRLQSFPKIHTTGQTDAMLQHPFLRTPAGLLAPRKPEPVSNHPHWPYRRFSGLDSVLRPKVRRVVGGVVCSRSIEHARLWWCILPRRSRQKLVTLWKIAAACCIGGITLM